MTARLDRRLALSESDDQAFAERRHLAIVRHAPRDLPLVPPPDLVPASEPTIAAWDCAAVVLGEPGPIDGGATAARFTGASEVRGVLEPHTGAGRKYWSLLATVRLDPGVASGTILSITGDGQEIPVRALVVRDGQLGVVAWSWRGGQALWQTQLDLGGDVIGDANGDQVRGHREGRETLSGRWAHLAATFGENGDLMLFVDGKVNRIFREDLHLGRHDRQLVRVGSATRFVNEIIPGWRGFLQNVELYDGALSIDEVRDKARAALGLPEPEPAAKAWVPPIETGCGNPTHQPAWRQDPAGELQCLECDPPRGCSYAEHQTHWRPAGDVFSPHWDGALECGLCLASPVLSAAV
ncbi:MAG TPA: LamG-like jellyroll fold domain-containing protein [Solirubrobacteraceae bacterium]|jgi:hypothetical protein|nr:LamG-like jellyroll fold domain-containing protein [Solirubrobacteraceae bacterium]